MQSEVGKKEMFSGRITLRIKLKHKMREKQEFGDQKNNTTKS